jgi:undecaprenyl-diphosphatase
VNGDIVGYPLMSFSAKIVTMEVLGSYLMKKHPLKGSIMQNAISPTLPHRSHLLERWILGSCALILFGIGLLMTIPTDPSWWKVVVLGIVQGITEFLPISSTGHLLVTAQVLHFEHSIEGTFEIFIQLGTVIAVIGYYARDLLFQIRSFPSRSEVRRLWLAVAIAFFPAAAIGFLVREWVKTTLFTPAVIAFALIGGGVVIVMLEMVIRQRKQRQETRSLQLRQALLVGCVQTLALIPGVSRSGASIVGGMLSGLDRATATTFAFYLAIPTLGAATIVDLLSSLNEVTSGDIGRLYLGCVVSLIVGWLSIEWLLRYVRQHTLLGFGWYRIVAGGTLLSLVMLGWM